MVHNSTVPYEDDKLPIPDIVDGQFNRSDALALGKLQSFSLSFSFSFYDLASFYKLTLPNIEFEFVTNIVHFSADSTNLFNRMDLNNSLNISTIMMNESNEQSLKRKLSDENQENEIQQISTTNT